MKVEVGKVWNNEKTRNRTQNYTYMFANTWKSKEHL